jgi:hypothetical protein
MDLIKEKNTELSRFEKLGVLIEGVKALLTGSFSWRH